MLYTTPMFYYCFLFILSLINGIVLAVPISGSLDSQTILGQLVGGVTPIQAIGYNYKPGSDPTYLNVAAPPG